MKNFINPTEFEPMTTECRPTDFKLNYPVVYKNTLNY